MIRIIRTAQSYKDRIPEIPLDFGMEDDQFNGMNEIPIELDDDEINPDVMMQPDPVPMADDDEDGTNLFEDLPNDKEPLKNIPELPEDDLELQPLQPSQDLTIPEPATKQPGVDETQMEEVDVPDIEIDKLNALPPKKQIDMVMAINLQRELGDTPMPPLMMEIDYLTLPHPSSGARRFLPKRAIKPEETRVFGTGRAIVTAWDFTKNDYRRFAVSQIQRSEIKEQ